MIDRDYHKILDYELFQLNIMQLNFVNNIVLLLIIYAILISLLFAYIQMVNSTGT